MAYANGLITGYPNQYDVQRALGTSEVGWKQLCTHTNINKWARYKPEALVGMAPVTHGTLFGQTNTRKNNHFGLNIPFCTNCIMNGMVHDIWEDRESQVAQDAWAYQPPRGSYQGRNEFYRITDFVRNPSDSADTTPSALQGYNHKAKFPFEVFLSQSGIVERYNSTDDFWYYEVNPQVISSLIFTFANSEGNDIHLQDLVNIGGTYASGVAWRPVLQAFKGSGSGANAWYNRGSILASNGDIEVGGAAITSTVSSLCTAALDLNSAPFKVNGEYVNYYFHVCVGVGCCKQDFSQWADNNNSLFIVPFTREQLENDIYPFYYIIKVVPHNDNRIVVTQLGWYNNASAGWNYVTSSSTFSVGVNSSQSEFRLQMTFTNVAGQSYDFVPENGSGDSGYKTMKVYAEESIDGNKTGMNFFLQPTNSSYTNAQHEHIGTSASSTIYAKMVRDGQGVSNIPAGGYATYHLKVQVDGSEYDDIGSFTIFRRTTT